MAKLVDNAIPTMLIARKQSRIVTKLFFLTFLSVIIPNIEKKQTKKRHAHEKTTYLISHPKMYKKAKKLVKQKIIVERLFLLLLIAFI